MTSRPFPTNSALTAIALNWRNGEAIADRVLPRVPVPTESFKYQEYPPEQSMTVPETMVGRRGAVGRIEVRGLEKTAAVEDAGLDGDIPISDIEAAAAQRRAGVGGFDPEARMAETLSDLIELDREIRTADLVFAAASYPAGNKVTLSGASQFSDAASDPIATIATALDAAFLVRPNVAVFGRKAWSALSRHPKIVKAVNRNDGDSGIASRQAVAELFELKEILVGESWLNIARPGLTPNFQRVWGAHLALLHVNPMAHTGGGVTFGLTAQFGARVAGSWDERGGGGLLGTRRTRVGEFVKELIVAPSAGYFIQNAAG